LFVTNALEDTPLPVYGTGQNTRDWVHVDDHCAALDLLLKADGVEGETFNVGASAERSILQIGEAILGSLGKPKSLLQSVQDRPGHVVRHAVDWTKLRDRLGWKPKTSFEIGLRQTVDWYRANEWWWRPIREGAFRDYYEVQYRGRRKSSTRG
jgi:dTDP-glucose 4,6-dehydratase